MSKLITSFHAELNEASYSSSIPREWRVANEFERILGGASLRALPRMPFWNSPCTAFIPLHLQFTIDNRQDLWYGCACHLEQTRHHAAPLTPLDSALLRNLAFCTILVQISRLESALTDTSLVTPLECTLTKTPGEGVSPPSSVPCRVSVVNPLLSSVCSLFALFLRLPSFVFSNLEPLSAKHPGGGYPTPPLRASFPRHMRHVAPLSPVPSVDCAYFPSPRGCTTPHAFQISLRSRHIQLPRPLFSYSYELLFPQPLFFHNHPHCPGVGGPMNSKLATRHSPLTVVALPA